jgi:hypothetical protein
MTMSPQRALQAAAAALGLTLLVGCAAPVSPEAQAPAEEPAIGLDCDALLAPAVLGDAFGPDLEPTALSFDGAGGYYTLAQLGLSAAGALRCEWSDGGASGTERYLTVSVLPEATDAWAALSGEVAVFQPQADAFGDASWHSCTETQGYSACRVDVLDGDRWLSAVLAGLTTTDAAATVVEAALGILATTDGAPAPDAPATPLGCDDILTAEDAGATLGVTVSRVDLPAPVQPVVFHAGFLEAGGTHCYWRNDLGSTSALTATLGFLPGGAATWDADWSTEPTARVDREAVDGLGDAAYVGCVTDVHCFASVRVGDDRLDVTVNDEGAADERALAIELARLALASR